MKVLKIQGLREIDFACKEETIPASSLKLFHLEGYYFGVLIMDPFKSRRKKRGRAMSREGR